MPSVPRDRYPRKRTSLRSAGHPGTRVDLENCLTSNLAVTIFPSPQSRSGIQYWFCHCPTRHLSSLDHFAGQRVVEAFQANAPLLSAVGAAVMRPKPFAEVHLST